MCEKVNEVARETQKKTRFIMKMNTVLVNEHVYDTIMNTCKIQQVGSLQLPCR